MRHYQTTLAEKPYR